MITVVIDGEEFHTNGRIEAAVRYILQQREQIEVMQKGSVEMHFAGKKFTPSIHSISREVEIAE